MKQPTGPALLVLAVCLVVWTTLLIPTPYRVVILRLYTKNENTATNTDGEQQNIRWSLALLNIFRVYLWLSENPKQLIKMRTHLCPSSSPLDVRFWRLLSHVLEPTDQPLGLDLNFWLSASESHSWLRTPFVLSSGLAGSHRHGSLYGLRAKIVKQFPLDTLAPVIDAADNSLLWSSIQDHSQRPTCMYSYIYIYTHDCSLSWHTMIWLQIWIYNINNPL